MYMRANPMMTYFIQRTLEYWIFVTHRKPIYRYHLSVIVTDATDSLFNQYLTAPN